MVLRVACTNIPNDLFIFGAWAEGKVAGPALNLSFHDLWQLNQKARGCDSDVVKVSCYGLPALLDSYELLPVGATLVREGGPIVVVRNACDNPISRLGIPGTSTTAWALYQHFMPEPSEVISLNYDAIVPALLSGEIDAGLLVHDNREGLQARGLQLKADLTQLWVQAYGADLPLGAVLAKKSAPNKELVATLRASAQYASEHADWFYAYCAEKSSFKSPTVIAAALKQWVSSESLELSEAGRKAMELFWEHTS